MVNAGTVTPNQWQNLTVPGTAVADYLRGLPASTLPLSLHHFLKFSAETIKRESAIESSPLNQDEDGNPVEEGHVPMTDGTEVSLHLWLGAFRHYGKESPLHAYSINNRPWLT